MKGQKQLKVVIKLGTSSIVDETTHQPKQSVLSMIVETAVKLRKDGHHVIIVSSGAIGVGLQRMEIDRKPQHLPKIQVGSSLFPRSHHAIHAQQNNLNSQINGYSNGQTNGHSDQTNVEISSQALAAIGQCRLMSLWDFLFNNNRQPVAQILLTRNDIADRTQYVNAQNTLSELLSMGVIPIVNENDTLAVTEIKFGDNDTLSAFTAAMVSADYLFLMTDVDCLYDQNPRSHPDAQPLPVVSDISTLQADVSSSGSALGTGGMSTKIVAAQLATSAGVTTIITRSSRPDNIPAIIKYTESLSNPTIPPAHLDNSSPIPRDANPPYPLHTRFIPSPDPIHSRSFWLLHTLLPLGTLYIDAGALAALSNGAGLLPAGVLGLEGSFSQQQPVRLVLIPNPNRSSASKTLSLDGDFTYHNLGMAIPPSSSGIPDSSPSSPRHSTSASGSTPASTSTLLTSRLSGSVGAGISIGDEVGRALVNYSSVEIARIRGVRSTQIARVLGYADSEYVCLRENIALVREGARSRPGTPGVGVGRGGGSGNGNGSGTGSGGEDAG